jgi:hypothetical protein
MWHRHPELLWELSALHLSWLAAYDPEQNAAAPLGWHRDFADAEHGCATGSPPAAPGWTGTGPTRQTSWPGERTRTAGRGDASSRPGQDFVDFVIAEVASARRPRTSSTPEPDPTTKRRRPMSRYAKKTDRRPYEERSFSVRAIHRERADLHKLAEVLIRLTLQETGESRAARAADRVPDTYRAPTDVLAAPEAAR